MPLLRTPDGRSLDVTVTGPADAVPLLFHHGTPSSKVQIRVWQRAAAARSLRLVTWSRPGYGGSTRRPGRRVVDDADDVAVLLDHLGAERCLVAGWSGGGPHALASAARLPDRVAGVLCVAGAAPATVPGLDFLAGMGEQNLAEFGAARAGEPTLRAYLDHDATGLRAVEASGVVAEMGTLLPPVDRAVLTSEYGEDLAASLRESVRTGVDGWLDDDLAIIGDWGFGLEEVDVPTFVWQGADDLMVPFAHGQWLGDHLPRATVHCSRARATSPSRSAASTRCSTSWSARSDPSRRSGATGCPEIDHVAAGPALRLSVAEGGTRDRRDGSQSGEVVPAESSPWPCCTWTSSPSR